MVVTTANNRLAGTIQIVDTSYSLSPTGIPRPLNIAENSGYINMGSAYNKLQDILTWAEFTT